MQTTVFHRFAYTCCTASFQPFCGMSAIRYKVLSDRAFPQMCYRTLVECKGSERRTQSQIYLDFVEPHLIFDEVKGSGFLEISVGCGVFFYSLKGVGGSKNVHKTRKLLYIYV